MPKLILLGALCGFLFGCDHLSLQDFAIQGAKKPAGATTLTLTEDLYLEFRRGVFDDKFTAVLRQGDYKAIIETDSGTFYLAPKGSFSYKNNDKVKSSTGGIFIKRIGGGHFVWLDPELRETRWEEWEEGANIEDMLPGVLFVEDRPWLEKDFVVPNGKTILK